MLNIFFSYGIDSSLLYYYIPQKQAEEAISSEME